MNVSQVPGCAGCPARELGGTFVPDEIKPGATIYLLNQNPGAEEEAQGVPMIGKTGQAWEQILTKDALMPREMVNVGNVIRCRWKGDNELPPVASVLVKQAMAHCQANHFVIPPETRLLVAAGDYACMALTGTTVADGDKAGSGWRGYLKPYDPMGVALKASPEGSMDLWMPATGQPLPVLVTWPVAKTFSQPWWTLPVRRDWAKVSSILAGKWPRKPPTFALEPPNPWPAMFTFDTEWRKDDPSKRLLRYSMAWGLGDGKTCVVEAQDHCRPVIVAGGRVVTQYAPADVHHLDRLTGFTQRRVSIWDRFRIEDAVWKHAVLWSDHQHDLNYLGSIYSSFNRWKHLGGSNPTLYAGLDATGLLEVDHALEAELDHDPRSRRVWEDIDRPALGEFVRAQYAGIAINGPRLAQAISQLEREVTLATHKARATVGWPIKLSSNPMVERQLYGIEGAKEPR